VSLEELIANNSATLTPTERKIARVILDDPMQVAFGTVAELAAQAQTSHPSVVRFAAKLGFDGYSGLQSWVQDGVTRKLSSPSQRIRHLDERTAERQGIENAVAAVFEEFTEDRLAPIAATLATARNVWILTGETSMAGARVLYSGLAMLRPRVTLVMEHSTGRDLAGAAPGDAAIVFDFARYRRSAVNAAKTLSELGLDLVAITDGPLSPLAQLTTTWQHLNIPAVGPFDSSTPAVVAAELIVSRTAEQLGSAARQRLDRLEAMWQASGTFLQPDE